MSTTFGVGDVVAGKYEILRELGTGAMGVVVEARHLRLNRSVALKFMSTRFMGMAVDRDAVQRFMREARAAARLRGENIAQVLDVGELDDGTPYIVMEYLEGNDLRAHLSERGRLPVAEAVGLILQACLAMAEAHQAGIMHRDLKPENLFLTRRPDGRPLVKVLDFGISKLFAGDEESSIRVETQNTQILGSPFYMSPEQIESTLETDARTDIWSLGVILYELTSRSLPYPHDGPVLALLARVVADPPRPLAQAAPDLPAALYRAVDRCLQKDAGQRWQSMAELAVALEPLADPLDRPTVASVCAIQGVSHRTTSQLERDSVVRTGARIASDARALAATAELAAVDPEALAGSAANAMSADIPAVTPAREPAAREPAAREPAAREPAEREPAGRGPSRRAVIEYDLDPGDGPLAVDLDVIPKRAPEERARRRIALRQIAYIAGAVVFGVITALFIAGTRIGAHFEPANQAIFRVGYAATRSSGELTHLLGGPVLQLGLPLLCIFVSSWFFYRFVTRACVWWLGQTLVHMAGYIADAGERARPPLAGEVHEWSALMTRWQQLDAIGDIATAFRWAGLCIMASAAVALLWRAWRPYERYV